MINGTMRFRAFSFQAWISSFTIVSGGGSNHLLIIKIQPHPGKKKFVNNPTWQLRARHVVCIEG